jgi:hypothetical protein
MSTLPVDEMFPFVSDEKLSMNMPDRLEPSTRHEGFKEWYEGVSKFIDQLHAIKVLDIQPRRRQQQSN